MRSLTNLPFVVRGAVVALVILIAAGVLFGPAGLRHEPRSAEASLFHELKMLRGSDTQNGDYFGYSVGVSGDTAIIGPFFENTIGVDIDTVYIFQQDSGGADNWGEVKKLTSADTTVGDGFGNSVAISGDTVVVGAYKEDASGTNAGAAYVFERNQGGTDNWGQTQKLVASDAAAGDKFSFKSVAVGGDTIVVGALFGDSKDGAAYVFRRNQGGTNNWGQVKKLISPEGGLFGRNVAVGGGDRLIVGANGDGTGAPVAGAAYIFERNQGGTDNWGQVAQLVASDAEKADFAGFAVALNGDIAVMGALGEDTNGSFAGAAYIFQQNSGGSDNWGEVKKLTASDGTAEDNFGYSAAASGDTVLVGTRYGEAAYVFGRDEGGADNWGEIGKQTASGASKYLGESVALSGNIAVLGANGGDAAYVFDLLSAKILPTATPTETPCGGPCPTPTPTNTPTNTATPTDTPTITQTPTITPTKQPFPGDTDGDGCSDQRENELGLDFLNPWDYFNPSGDGFIRMDDILGVIEHYSPEGDPPYDALYDRSIGPGGLGPPDGVIDLPNDILSIVLRYHDDCATPPPPGPTPPASAGLAFSIGVDTTGSAANDCDTSGGVTKCTLLDYTFRLSIYLDSLPNGVLAYTALNTAFTFSGVTPANDGDLTNWVDCVGAVGVHLSSPATGEASLACPSYLIPTDFVASTYTGLIGTMLFHCDADGQISMVHGEIDTALFEDSTTFHIEENASTETLTITCPDTTDTDGDGCSDQRENGSDETLGGMRDWQNPNDYYDVLGPGAALPVDGIIDLPNDILGVIQHFSPQGQPPYDVQFDRGPATATAGGGPNPWNMTAPDGVIDLPNDILGVILQFQHNCG